MAAGGGRRGSGIWPGSVSQFGGGGALTAAPLPVPVGLQGSAGNFRSAPLYFLNLAGQLQVATDGDRGEVSERLPSRMHRPAQNAATGYPPGGGGGLLDSPTDYSGGLSGLIVSTPCDMNDGMDMQSGMSLAVSRGLMKIGSQNSERSDCGSGGNSRFAAAAAATAAVAGGGGTTTTLSRPGSYQQQQHPGSPRPLGVATPPSISRDLLRIGSQSSERSETATNSGTLPRPLQPPQPPPPPPPMFAVTSIPESALMGRGGMMRPMRRSSVGLLATVPLPPAAKQ